ncbi:hypothetical protein SLEP1_g57833 [Rubroshorea leprosula]|uniref:Uncharacterized protein n=1 Tax=Rubroshorea leprosula TaxID=152421 RepID=A0AAV5MR02_9ROSI|nr:hypothetical protein SLEP1_g57833 [Rubroshorea leprosula]
MENWSSFLFGGTNLDKKKFAGVFDWFKDKKETDSKVEDLPLFDNRSLEPREPSVSIKKRKRKQVASVSGKIGSVEGFSVVKEEN